MNSDSAHCTKPLRMKPSCLLIVLALAAAAGCQRTARDLSLDVDQARQACATTLDAWKDGKQPADLKPGIIASDYVWKSGGKLVSYEFLPDEFNDGTNLHIQVSLTVADESGAESESTAVYVVGTSPVVTVFRD